MSATRRSSVASNLKLSEAMFASADEKALIRVVDEGLAKVEDGIKQAIASSDRLVDRPAHYLADAGGKRVRPMLALITAQLGTGISPEVIDAAVAIEVTHLATLYHDDVMDDADRRRGVPAAHTVWGNSVAILTGDLLFARASQLMSNLGEDAIRLQADTFVRLVMGQLHETIGPTETEDPIQHYFQVLQDKTGSLIATAAKAGVLFAGGDQQLVDAMGTYGEKIGVAFQLVDDVLDLAPADGSTGKVPGTDLRAGVVTLPLLKLRALAEAAPGSDDATLLVQLEAEVIGTGQNSDQNIDQLVERLRSHSVTADTLAEARTWAAEAVAALDVVPDGPVKRALLRFSETVIDRTS